MLNYKISYRSPIANVRELPDKYGNSTGYYLLAIIDGGNKFNPDRYIVFINNEFNSIWIEKHANPLSSFLNMNDLIKIESDDEWQSVFNYAVQEKILESKVSINT